LTAFLRFDAMRLRRPLLGALAGACVPLVPFDAIAADKAAVACIQSAEQGEGARKAGQLLHARELFAQCSARECPGMLRRDCAAWLEDADRQIPSIVLGAHDAEGRDVIDARASVDGSLVRERLDGNPIALDPGSHAVRFERAGLPPVELHVVLRAGEKNRPILATLAPPAPPAPLPAPVPTPAPAPAPIDHSRHVPAGAWLLGGAGVVALGVFGYFGVTGMNDANMLRSTCAPGCTDAQVQSVRWNLVAADIGLGVGALSLAAATWIGVRALTRSKAAAWDLVLVPAPNAARAGVVIRF
jgi:hypothetical protein